MRRQSARRPRKSESAEWTGRLVYQVRAEVSLRQSARLCERDPLL